MADEPDYRELELARQRQAARDYINAGIPVSAKHDTYLRERAAMRRPQEAYRDPRVQQTHSHNDYYDRAEVEPRHGSWEPSDPAPSRAQARPPQYDRKANSPKENEWPILLNFENGHRNARYEGRVLLDTGAEDNWIALDIVEQYDLPSHPDPDNEVYQDFSGRAVQSLGIVTGLWIHKHAHIPVSFRIAKDPPFKTLFGYRHLRQHRILEFQGGPVAPLVAGRPSREERRRIDENQRQAQQEAQGVEQYREWKRTMEAQGWHWSTTHNAFYRMNRRGETEWQHGDY